MYDVPDRLSVGGDVITQSNEFFRGDESNTADTLDGFAIANATQRIASLQLPAGAAIVSDQGLGVKFPRATFP